MEDYFLDWSKLTRRVYITNGKKKKDVTEWYEKIVAVREQLCACEGVPTLIEREENKCEICNKPIRLQ